MPAKDFEQSKRFYSELGFVMSERWGGTADFELGAKPGQAARGTAWKPMRRYLYLKILATASSKDGLSVPI
jgi:hypothetical protein